MAHGALIRSIVTLGDSLLGGSVSRRSVASRLAERLRPSRGPLLPLDLSAGGLSGALRHGPELQELAPSLLVLCLGYDDAERTPSPSWWLADAEALLHACGALGAELVLVLAPPPPELSARARRWHERAAKGLGLAGVGRATHILDLSGSPARTRRHLQPDESAVIAEQIGHLLGH
jgi:hypothetical protein